MFLSKFFPLLWVLALPEIIGSAKISFFGSNHKHPLFRILGKDCPYGITLDVPVEFSCACFTGLWALYSTGCNAPPAKIIGSLDEHCVFLNQTIQKLHLLSSPDTPRQMAVVFTSGLQTILGRGDPKVKDAPLLIPGSGRVELLLSAGHHNWSLNPINQCLGVNPNDSFCFYRYDTKNYITLEPHCGDGREDMQSIPAEDCVPYVKEHSAECLDVVKAMKIKKKPPHGKPKSGRTLANHTDEASNSDIKHESEKTSQITTTHESTGMIVTEAESGKRAMSPKSDIAKKDPKPTSKQTVNNQPIYPPMEPPTTTTRTTFPTTKRTTKATTIVAPTPKLTTTTTTKRTTTKPRKAPSITQFKNISNPKGDELEIIVVKAPAPHLYKDMVKAKGQGRQGRTFLGRKVGDGSGASANNSLPDYHEDKDVLFSIQIPEISSQIWNYMTSRALEILNLTTPSTKAPLSPSFSFLQISKKIMQKACPDHYVGDGHFELAVQTFISLQKKVFSFNDVFSDYPARQRIEDTLNLCLQNVTEYPFLDTRKRNGTNCSSTVEMGTFAHHGGQSILNISETASPLSREPLIETVWKIFTHAHSACFGFFEENGFNDHHRFTSVLIPLFTNGINDMWKNITELNEDTYSGLLGDTVRLMEGVAHCAEFPKLETEYPWELSRPEKEIQEAPKESRRKRSVTGEGVCLRESYENSCIETPSE